MKMQQHYIWWLLVLGLIGFTVYNVQSSKVFPSASIDLTVPRQQIATQAATARDGLGYKKKNAVNSTIFTFDDDAKTFLEYELGTAKANELMLEHIPVWYWVSRSCIPLKQEEMSTWISPQGKLRAFEHTIENDRKLPSLTLTGARIMAMDFVRKVGEVDLSHYKLIEQGSVSQPARTDQQFTWEDTQESLKGARLRVHAYVSGNLLTAYNHYLHVPEEFNRRFAKLRSYNDALENAATIFYYAIYAGAFFVFLWALASGTLRWRFALAVALLYAGISRLDTLNSLPSAIHEYDTSLPWSGFQLSMIVGIVSAGLSTFVQTLVLVGAAEAIYRLMKPEDIALEKSFTEVGLRSKKILSNIIAGFGTFGLHLGWVVAFYLAGRSFGFWSPLDIDNADTLSSTMPFFSAMETGWSAGLTEELMYRVLGLAAFRKIFRNFWVANLLQAAAWAFMHSNYPQEPPYARGLELTVAGLVYGFVLRRFGLLACFLSHNLVDTFMGVNCLLSSSNHVLQASAFLALAPFIGLTIVALVLIKKRGFANGQEELTASNQTLTVKKETLSQVANEIMPKGYLYRPLTLMTRLVLFVVVIASLAISVFLRVPVVANHTQLKVTREQAVKTATAYLQEHGVKTDDLSYSAWLCRALDPEEMQYCYENVGRKQTDTLSMNPERPLWWQVRFFHPLVETEYKVVLDQNGTPMSFALVEPEEEPGESPNKADAQKRVEQFLRSQHPEIEPFQLEDVTEQKREARIDYSFRYNVPKYRVGEAPYHAQVDCIGGKVSGYDTGWLLPDKWVFERGIVSMREQICSVIEWVVGLGCLIPILIWARGVLRSGAVAWKPAIMIGASLTLLTVGSSLNSLVPNFYQEYSTKDPLVTFYVAQGAQELLAAMTAFAEMTLAAAFGLAAMRLLLPDTSVSAILKSAFAPAGRSEAWAHRHLWADAVLIGYAAGFGQQAFILLSAIVHARVSPSVSIASLDQFSGWVNVLQPTLGLILEAIPRGFDFIFVTACLAGIYAKYIRNFKTYALLCVAASIITVSTYKHWQDAGIDLVTFVFWYLFSWLLVVRLAKENLLAYFLAGITGALIGALRLLPRYGDGLFKQDSIAIVVVLLAPAMYALLRNVGSTQKDRAPTERTSDGAEQDAETEATDDGAKQGAQTGKTSDATNQDVPSERASDASPSTE